MGWGGGGWGWRCVKYTIRNWYYLTLTMKLGIIAKVVAKLKKTFIKVKGYIMLQTEVQNPGRASGSLLAVELSPHDVMVALIQEHEP